MKKVFAIFFVFLFLYNSLGFIVQFYWILNDWHRNIKQVLVTQADSPHLKYFYFGKEDFDIHTHEFKKEGHFYDVLKVEIVNDSVIVTCYEDTHESQLYSEYHHLLVQDFNDNPETHKKSGLLFKSLLKDFLPEKYISFSIPIPSVKIFNKRVFTEIGVFKSSYYARILKPPQRSC